MNKQLITLSDNAAIRIKEVKENIMKVEGVSEVSLNLVWEPPWNKDKMSEAAKLELNL